MHNFTPAAGGGHFREPHRFGMPFAISEWAPRAKKNEISIMQEWLGLCICIIVMQVYAKDYAKFMQMNHAKIMQKKYAKSKILR